LQEYKKRTGSRSFRFSILYPKTLKALAKTIRTPYIQLNRAPLTNASFIMVLATEKSLLNRWLFFISFQLNNGLKSVVNVVTTSIACKVFLSGKLTPGNSIFLIFQRSEQ